MYKQAGIVVRKVKIGNIVSNIYFEDINLPWLILIPGLPQYFHKQSYFKDLVEKYVVLTPYYPGSFHSYGEFNIEELKQVIPECIKFIHEKKFYDFFESKLYEHQDKIAGIIGLSFGANLIIDYLLQNKSPENTKYSMISPLFDMNNAKVVDYWDKKLGFLSSEVYTQIYNGLNKAELENFFRVLTNEKPDFKQDIYLIVGAGDKYVTRSFIENYFPNATHFFLESVGHEVDKLLELALEKNLIF